ncbi:MAG TPA: right-handed parallel beta-helix repeat-containing protein [Ignavibacteria bacterium]|nr:right-handed parallel beta-helix repeat-containing protein [Ignavibacteria bacterium]
MKKILVLLFLFFFSNSYSNYSTPGTGVKWDLDSLVAYSLGNVTMSGSNYMINDTINISAGDTVSVLNNATMKLAQGVFVDIFGVLIINPPDSVLITAQDTTLKYLGLKFEDLSDGSLLKKVIMEYGNSIRMLDCSFLIDSCTIRYNTQNSSFATGAISFFRSNSVVSNCKIFRNRRAAFVSGANIASSPQILNNLILENDVDNANTPQINFGATGPDPMIIRGNTIIGLYVMSGGISFLPVGSIPKAIIEDNIIKKNRYGIAVAGGSSNFYINNNIIDSNNIQGSPTLGGSGINFNGTATQSSIVTRNVIRGNLWGITIQGTAKPNMGDLTSADTTDVGLNEIYNNGNSGKTFDLFNNTIAPVFAENNYWGTGIVDSVEKHIFHNADSTVLGVVDYLPLRSIILNLNVGMEGLVRSTGRMGRTDTVTVYLRDTAAPYAILDSAKGPVDTVNYFGQFAFTAALSNYYYIVVKHFNSIEIWSKAGGESLVSNSAITNPFSFITDASQAYGNNLILTRTRYCMYSGDINQDGFVDNTDLIAITNDVNDFVSGIRLATDLTGDDFVDTRDLIRCYNNSSVFAKVESPLTK